MRKLVVLVFLVYLTSCKKDDTITDSALFHDWKWLSTSHQTIPGFFLIPHYYNFQKNGVLQMIDTGNVVRYQWQYSIPQIQHLFINGSDYKQNYTYTIKNDTLKLEGNIEEIDAETNKILNSMPVTHLFKIQN